ncbi:hypothetical protein [Ruminococcus flavefaciens]|uniref:hypothetical protein n=1 Tax=Ruminococcus flavefaciens TaxID=1265 RepID=UPI0026F118A1|nr:hypothetical protein [Ruminococcus flavefaciens]
MISSVIPTVGVTPSSSRDTDKENWSAELSSHEPSTGFTIILLPLISVTVALQILAAGAVCSVTWSVGCCAGAGLESMPQAVRNRHSAAVMSNLGFN